eukprot:Polyplicarium_translucidae@DN1380_c0_g1_i1.p2
MTVPRRRRLRMNEGRLHHRFLYSALASSCVIQEVSCLCPNQTIMSTTNPKITTTEWDDLQIKHGNYAPRPKEVTEEELTGIAIDYAETVDPLAKKTIDELDALEDEAPDDVLQRHREKRLAELRERAARARHGELMHLHKDEYLAEVTEASRNSWVVVALYSEQCETSQRLLHCLDGMARRHADVKFMKGIASKIVDRFPDRNAPTLLLYHGGACAKQLVAAEIWGRRGATPSTEAVTRTLRAAGVLEALSDEEGESFARRKGPVSSFPVGEDRSDDEKDGRGYMSTRVGRRW